ncbi:uncharacterized protein isoform X2 [Choristoneura fumiferana]|uniref:uncharacterized protein isoform X2 n=1 Tax=Choristoneura fumiferana TaxID=7141 RepID=UPI003D15851C
MNLCRACLSSDVELVTIDDSFVCDYNLLTNLNVKLLDGKSQRFCHTCVETVNYFIEFRNKCTSSELTLQQTCSSQVIKIENQVQDEDDIQTVIKGEIKLEKYDVTYNEFDGKPEDDDECDIKLETKYDLPQKKTKKRVKKKKSVSKKILNVKSRNSTTNDNYIKIISDNPACGLCGKLFDDICLLKKHLAEHKTDHSCQLCPDTRFEEWPQLLAHRLLHTVKYQQCHLCDQRFRSHTHLEYHYWKVHCDVNKAALACKHCPRKFSSPRKLSKHIWRSHSSRKYVCDICSKEYNNKKMLEIHITGHGDVRRYVCNLCGYRSKFRTGLHAHTVRRHSPHKCICNICERAFADHEKMAKHVCTEVSKICPVCGKNLRKGERSRMLATGATCGSPATTT